MKKNFINRAHISGYIYEHDLQERVTGENSKNPNTQYISGTVSIATDDAKVNIVPIHYTYVTATTKSGGPNPTYTTLKQIIDGTMKSITNDGADNASMVRADTSIALNDFYTNRNGEEELVSAKRYEGGFIHPTNILEEHEKDRNEFECDFLITGARRQEANEERGIAEKVIVKGAVFNFRNELLPLEFSVLNSNAMNYFEGLEASDKNPIFTRIKGRQVSETIVRKIEEESAWGEISVREVSSSRKDWIIHWAQGEPYLWDDESTLTAIELKEMMGNRATYLAGVKKRADDYRASRATAVATPTVAPDKGEFKFW